MTEFGGRKVILYELNEVPWSIIDRQVSRRPRSALSQVVTYGKCETTVNYDTAHLQPWRTWPTYHTGLYTREHRSYELGQDPSSFCGEPIWEAVEDRGKKIGLFGPLQSWPARQPKNGGFYVPDTFSKSAETFPSRLESFQQFNLAMTREQGYSSVNKLDWRRSALAGLRALSQGLTPRSVAQVGFHLLSETRDARYKGSRSTLQALPTFDLFWKLHRRELPDLSIYFTNHVAGMLHRYWGDAVAEYRDKYDYDPDSVFGTFIDSALDIVESHFCRILKFIHDRPEYVLVVASSMGQDAIASRELDKQLVVKSSERLLSSLQLSDGKSGLAMYPRYTYEFSSADRAGEAATRLSNVEVMGRIVFRDLRIEGSTVSAAIAHEDLKTSASGGELGVDRAQRETERKLDELGLGVDRRIGGSNTAYHVPEGIHVTYGAGVGRSDTRTQFDIVDAKGRLLEIIG